MSSACVCDDVFAGEATQTLVSNSEINWVVTLLGADGMPLVGGIPTGSDVRYALLNWDRSSTLINTKTSHEIDPDADWPNARAVVRFDKVDTSGLAAQDAWLEVKVDNLPSAFRRILIEKGLIVVP